MMTELQTLIIGSYGIANIGLLTGIFFRLGGQERTNEYTAHTLSEHGRRIFTLETKALKGQEKC